MKKTLFLVSFLVMGVFSLTSCGGSDDDAPVKTVDLNPAVNYFKTILATTDPDDALSGKIKHIGFGAGEMGEAQVSEEFAGKLVPKGGNAPIRIVKPKGILDGFVYILFTYICKEGNKYEIPGVALIEFTDQSGKTATFTIKLYETDEIIQGRVSLSPTNFTEKTSYLCGDWNIAHTNFVYREYNQAGKVANTYEYNFNHGRLTDMADKLFQDHKVDIRQDIAKKGDINKISFTPNNRWWIDFSYGSPSCGDWSWTNESNGDFKYTWDDKDMSVNFENGTANVYFEGSNAFLQLNGEGVKNDGCKYKVWVTLRMAR